jgi:hypothetical protein
MNERIRELADEADKLIQNQYLVRQQSEWCDKFAELIVRECLEACSRANEIRHFVPPTQEQVVLSCMREIEQHFGVES